MLKKEKIEKKDCGCKNCSCKDCGCRDNHKKKLCVKNLLVIGLLVGGTVGTLYLYKNNRDFNKWVLNNAKTAKKQKHVQQLLDLDANKLKKLKKDLLH